MSDLTAAVETVREDLAGEIRWCESCQRAAARFKQTGVWDDHCAVVLEGLVEKKEAAQALLARLAEYYSPAEEQAPGPLEAELPRPISPEKP